MGLFGGSDESLVLTVKAKDEASSEIKKVQSSIGDLAKGFAIGSLAVSGLKAGFSFLTDQLGSTITAFNESEAVLAQTNAVLQSTGHAAGMSSEELVNLSKSLQKVTTYGDEAILSAENMLLTFTNIGQNVFPQATQTILDMSVALGQDTKNSAIQLGKALNDPINGVTALQRVGVTFTDKQKDVIATMVKTGDTIGAQKVILAELSKEFGGSATAAAKTFGGQMMQLNERIGDVKEEVGHGLTAALYNMMSAFSTATAGMGDNIDVGKTSYQVFTFIEEAIVNTTVGLYEIAKAFEYAGTWAAEAMNPMTAFSSETRKQYSDLRAEITGSMDTAKNFALDLMDQNKATLNSWGQMTTESKKFAAAGPTAYEETGKAAEEAANKIKEANKAIKDTKQKIADLQDEYAGQAADTSKSLAEAIVKQEEHVRDLKIQIYGEDDAAKRNLLQLEYNRELEALTAKKDMRTALMQQVQEEYRRAGETEFERTVEDIQRKFAEETKAYNKKNALLLQELADNEDKRKKLDVINKQISASVITESAKSAAAVHIDTQNMISDWDRLKASAQAASSAFTFTTSQSGAFSTANSTSMFSKHEFGGIVPGPQGMPVGIIAHGQEQVIPAGKVNHAGGGVTININNPVVRSDEDIMTMRAVIEEYFRSLAQNYKLSY